MGKLFKGIGQTKMSMQSNYAKPGRYVVFIQSIKVGTSRKGEDFVAVQKKCLEVIASEGDQGHYPGEEFADLQMARHDSFLPNFKSMVYTLSGADSQDEIDEEACDYVTSDDQPFAGLIVEVDNITRVGKDSGKEYTRKSYKRVLTEEEIEERFTEEELTKLLTKEEMKQMASAYQSKD